MRSEWILGRLAAGCGLNSVSSGMEQAAGCYERGDESYGCGATELVSSSDYI
jgi:hypothetical protein